MISGASRQRLHPQRHRRAHIRLLQRPFPYTRGLHLPIPLLRRTETVPTACAASQCASTSQTDQSCKIFHPRFSRTVSYPALNAPTSCSSIYLGSTHNLGQFLSSHLPLIFPPQKPPLGYTIVQGVACPPDAEMAWLGACMAGADGWVNIMVGLARS